MSNRVDNTLRELADRFISENPGAEIEVQGVQDTDQTVKIWMASNELPDITVCPSGVKQSTYKDYFMPLNDLGFSEDTIYFYQNGVGDQSLYQVASSISIEGMLYNKKVFADAGITAMPKTQEELLAACEKIKALGVTPLASLFNDKWPLGRWAEFGPAAISGNANYLNDKVNSDELVSDTLLDVYSLLRDMNSKGYLESDLMSTNWDQFKMDFGAAKVGMVYLGTWLPPQIVENGGKMEEIGMFPLPGGKATANADNMYAIAANSESPELAKSFFRFLFAEPNFATACGLTSAVKGVVSDDPVAAEILSYGTPIEMPALSEEYNALISKAQIDREAMTQEILLAPDLNTAAAGFNTKWADARQS
jgi:raffinose/stachyose/melibiose transport system substrate-binding protein